MLISGDYKQRNLLIGFDSQLDRSSTLFATLDRHV